jgi:hypothetical protein
MLTPVRLVDLNFRQEAPDRNDGNQSGCHRFSVDHGRKIDTAIKRCDAGRSPG